MCKIFSHHITWCGDERRYLSGLSKIIYKRVDIEMDDHSYAAYAVFLRFLEALRRTRKLFMVEYF